MTRLVQLRKGDERRVALVEEPNLRLLDRHSSIFELANDAIATGRKLSEAALASPSQELLEYEAVYNGTSPWQVMPAVDHPEPSRCLVSGTGLTHMGSAKNRQSMHADAAEQLTDSMRMFCWGLEGGRPTPGSIGTAPEWFYKGTGTTLRAHGEPLDVPAYAGDGGEEAEIAGLYLIGPEGQPHRLGFAAGNEFSDHRFEKTNYLNLAASKLRTCAIGPELAVDAQFQSIPVEVRIERGGDLMWSKGFRSGEAEMCHSLQNLEHHHFKFEAHRRPGDIHVHFFGTDGLSFSDGIELLDGDVMQVACEGFGRPLRNPVCLAKSTQPLIRVIPME